VKWITTLYISKALQGCGLGNSAMDAVEEMARSEIKAKDVGLDTMAKEMAVKVALERPLVCDFPLASWFGLFIRRRLG
jgi:hypothetical protein